MDNITINESVDAHTGAIIQTVVIKNDENSFTQMLKSTYDEMIANQSAQIEGVN
jgi:hypothetical protein